MPGRAAAGAEPRGLKLVPASCMSGALAVLRWLLRSQLAGRERHVAGRGRESDRAPTGRRP